MPSPAARKPGLRSQPSTRSAISGALSRMRSSVLAAPVGPRLPCSQLRIVSCDTPMRRANSTCVRPMRLRTRRANRAMSRIASASSSRCCEIRSPSVVLCKTA